MKQKKEHGQPWEGWYFSENCLIDDFGNRYTERTIRECHFLKQMPDVSKELLREGCKNCAWSH